MIEPLYGAKRILRNRSGVLILWLLAAIAVPIWVAHDSSAWDLRVYGTAVDSLRLGHDPYSDATAIQKEFYARLRAHGSNSFTGDPPYSYVYSPLTLPVLRLLRHIPQNALVPMYWLAYIAGALSTIAVGVSLGTERERTGLLYIAGVAPFFPGVLANGTVLSGNVAYILYGAVLVAALRGWRSNRWLLFYVAVLIASCIKAPLLSLALIPSLSARRQWIPSMVTIISGVAIFGSQMLLWPSLFRHYLEAVELQFSLNHDFGCSPAGLVGQALYHYGLPYSTESSLLYVAYAVPLTLLLIYLSRAYLRGAFTSQQWIPVLLLGIVLLNPRIMEYDMAPVTVPMALICWRLTFTISRSRAGLALAGLAFVLLNALSLYSWEWRKALDGPLLTALFCAGAWMLFRERKVMPTLSAETAFQKSLALHA